MRDSRVEAYARLLVEDCLQIEPRDQVLLASTILARPLVEEIQRLLGRKGAYVLPRIMVTGAAGLGPEVEWIVEAPLELLAELPPLERHVLEGVDAVIAVSAPENTRAGSAIPPERMQAVQESGRSFMTRLTTGDVQWVGCAYPTPALAQDAGLGLRELEDFLFGACLLDWDAERERMRRYADRLDAADEVRIVGPETDLTLSIRGRKARIDAGGRNIPGGEFFYSPVEDSASGAIAFTEFATPMAGRDVAGIRFRLEAGRVVDASAESHEDFLLSVLDTDEGARRLGELGIGCNPGITRYMRNVLFDEKMDGTVHLAIGAGFPDLGGTNESAVHYDIVKDLRNGGELYADGELVQKDGAWLI